MARFHFAFNFFLPLAVGVTTTFVVPPPATDTVTGFVKAFFALRTGDFTDNVPGPGTLTAKDTAPPGLTETAEPGKPNTGTGFGVGDGVGVGVGDDPGVNFHNSSP